MLSLLHRYEILSLPSSASLVRSEGFMVVKLCLWRSCGLRRVRGRAWSQRDLIDSTCMVGSHAAEVT